MKKLLSLIFLALITSTLTAQDFPGKHYNVLLGKKVTVKTLGKTTPGFFKKPNLNSHAFADRNTDTPSEKLEGKVFMIIGFEKNSYGTFFVLSNAEVGKIYFWYIMDDEDLFLLKLEDGFEYKDDVCSEIATSTDKFTDEIKKRMSTDYKLYFSRSGNEVFTILKTKSKTLVVGKKGVTMLLEDGSKIKDTETEIDVKTVDDGYYEYSAVFRLTPEDIEKLKKSYVTDYRLYIFDEHVNSGRICKKILECILSN